MVYYNTMAVIKEQCGYCYTKAVFLQSKNSIKHKTIQYTKQSAAPHLDEREMQRVKFSFERNKNTRAALFGLSTVSWGFAYTPSLLSWSWNNHHTVAQTHTHIKCMTHLNAALSRHQCRSSGYGSKEVGTYCGRLCQHLPEQSLLSDSLRRARQGKKRPDVLYCLLWWNRYQMLCNVSI